MSSFGRTKRSASTTNSSIANGGVGVTGNSSSRGDNYRKASEDLYVKPYVRPGTTAMASPTRRTISDNRSKSPNLPFGTKDPLSYGVKKTGTTTSFPKYEANKVKASPIPGVERSTPGSKNTSGSGSSPPKLFSGTVKFKPFVPGGGDVTKKVKPGVQDYEALKKKCLASKTMFEDPAFPAADSSLFYSQSGKKKLIWKRPKEICDNPKFFVDGVSRFDVKQGSLGNCWFLAAVGNLTIHEDLFYNVVPRDNSFVVDYCGIFHFRFWQYGNWVEVVVDDRLPCDPISGNLCFMHSYESNEFWGALMEKAYAKLYGSYEALDGGNSNEALQDFCGGIVEIVMTKETEEDIAKLIDTAFRQHSFICCAVANVEGSREAVTSDGLVHGHAYTVTAFNRIEIAKPRKSTVTLVRIRNPWGSDTEWNGAWSDGSKEWNSISDETKRTLEVKDRKDGEFWMSIHDFKEKFYKLDICNLSPSLYKGVAVEGKKWNESDYNGKWIPHATAGGCGNYTFQEPLTYATNPQFIVEFDTPDEDGDGTCTVLIGLVQKNRRAKKKEGANSLCIGYSIYCLNGLKDLPNPLDLNFFKRHNAIGSSGKFAYTRVVNARFKLEPGTYCIVPSTFEPNQEGEFVLRVFSESNNKITENGGVTGLDKDGDDQIDDEEEDDTKDNKPPVKLTKEQEIKKTAMTKLFEATAGEDGEIGWSQLKQLLDSYFKREFKFNGFGGEVCRSLVALLDKDRSGKIGPSEFETLWPNILEWKNAFKKFDEDHSNNMNARELRAALKSVGIKLSNRTLETLVLRYGNDNGSISFEDFILCTVKLNAMLGTFKEFREKGSEEACFNLEDWLEKTIYS